LKALITALLIATPAFADELLTMDFDNQSSRVVEAVSVYPVNDAGEIVDDNIGSIVDPIAPGAIRRLDLALVRCGKVWARATFAGGEEVTAETDLCRNQRLILTD
jgi:hypothetical protein